MENINLYKCRFKKFTFMVQRQQLKADVSFLEWKPNFRCYDGCQTVLLALVAQSLNHIQALNHILSVTREMPPPFCFSVARSLSQSGEAGPGQPVEVERRSKKMSRVLGLSASQTWVQIPILLLMSYAASGKSFKLLSLSFLIYKTGIVIFPGLLY